MKSPVKKAIQRDLPCVNTWRGQCLNYFDRYKAVRWWAETLPNNQTGRCFATNLQSELERRGGFLRAVKEARSLRLPQACGPPGSRAAMPPWCRHSAAGTVVNLERYLKPNDIKYLVPRDLALFLPIPFRNLRSYRKKMACNNNKDCLWGGNCYSETIGVW